MNHNNLIDFVICWVDGNDPEWRKEKSKYSPGIKTDSRGLRYRDWNNLQYLFRGIEKYASWVNKIHFVTWGHIPTWLNVEHPKINIVRHKDFIPNEYLPTFSARPIEINLHRINGLSNQFVYFNDDMFILRDLKKTDFFKNGLPRDVAVLDNAMKNDEAHGAAFYNSVVLINYHFSKSNAFKKHFFKWINYKYGKLLLRTILLSPWKMFSGFYTPHLPNAFLKQTFYDVWNKELDVLNLTSNNKFRSKLDVTQYLFKFWQLAAGDFLPRKNIGKLFKIGTLDLNIIQKVIEKQEHKLICLNDSDEIENFDRTKQKLINSFDVILPEKSTFEI